MPRVSASVVNAPTKAVQPGTEFVVSIEVDNLENVPPLLPGGCDCNPPTVATDCGEKVDVELQVLDGQGNQVGIYPTSVCAGYGIAAPNATAVFRITISKEGTYVINPRITGPGDIDVSGSPSDFSVTINEAGGYEPPDENGAGGDGGFDLGNFVITHPIETGIGMVGFAIIVDQLMGE